MKDATECEGLGNHLMRGRNYESEAEREKQ